MYSVIGGLDFGLGFVYFYIVEERECIRYARVATKVQEQQQPIHQVRFSISQHHTMRRDVSARPLL